MVEKQLTKDNNNIVCLHLKFWKYLYKYSVRSLFYKMQT